MQNFIFVTFGLAAVLTAAQTSKVYRSLIGTPEARRIAFTCRLLLSVLSALSGFAILVWAIIYLKWATIAGFVVAAIIAVSAVVLLFKDRPNAMYYADPFLSISAVAISLLLWLGLLNS